MTPPRRWPAVTGALTSLFLVAACAGAPPPAANIEPVAPEPAETATAVEPPPEPEVAVVPPPPPPPPVPDVETFLNRNGVEIAGVLGEPGFVRRDPPAELWQYRAAACTLDLFFYDDGDEDYRLAYLDFRGVGDEPEARDECLRAIIELTES